MQHTWKTNRWENFVDTIMIHLHTDYTESCCVNIVVMLYKTDNLWLLVRLKMNPATNQETIRALR